MSRRGESVPLNGAVETSRRFRTGNIQFRVLSRTFDPKSVGVKKDSALFRYFNLARGLDLKPDDISTGELMMKSMKSMMSWMETVFVTAPTTVMNDWSDTIAEGLAYDSKLDVGDMASAPFVSIHRMATSSNDEELRLKDVEKWQIIELFLRELQIFNPRYVDDLVPDVTEIPRYRTMIDMLSGGNGDIARHMKTMTVHQLILCEAAITVQCLFRGFLCRKKMLLKLVEERESLTSAFIVRAVRGFIVEDVIVQLPQSIDCNNNIKVNGKDIPARECVPMEYVHLGRMVLRLRLENGDFSASYFTFSDEHAENAAADADHDHDHDHHHADSGEHQPAHEEANANSIVASSVAAGVEAEADGIAALLSRTYVADIAQVKCYDDLTDLSNGYKDYAPVSKSITQKYSAECPGVLVTLVTSKGRIQFVVRVLSSTTCIRCILVSV
jgi:hypothetical protein